MAAYHNPDWAECYDLWVRQLFGDGPAEDIPIFEKVLKEICAAEPAGSTITIVDVGTGSGRILIGLQAVMQEVSDRMFEVWGTEPSAPMLDRAKRFWNEDVEKKRASPKQGAIWIEGHIRDHWAQSSATHFADELSLSQGVDLVIFAAGGFSHITADDDIRVFLGQVSRILRPYGKAVISILRDYMPEADDYAFTTFGANDKKPDPKIVKLMSESHRIPSQDHAGVIYTKHPPIETRNEDIKTQSFRLDVEDSKGRILRTQELSWDAKLFDALLVLDWMRDEAGLKLAEVIEGDMQIWWVLQKTHKSVHTLRF